MMTRKPAVSDVEALLDQVDPATTPAIDTTAVADIAQLVDKRAVLDDALLAAIATARRQGHSWGHIAIALGVSRQAARQTYAPRTAEASQP